MLDIHQKTGSTAQDEDQETKDQCGPRASENVELEPPFGGNLEVYQSAVRSVKAASLAKGEGQQNEENVLVEAQTHLLALAVTYEEDKAFAVTYRKEFDLPDRKNTSFGLVVVKSIVTKHGSSLPKTTASDWAKDLQGYHAAKITPSFESVYDFRNKPEDVNGNGNLLTRRRKAHAYADLAKTTGDRKTSREMRRVNAQQKTAERWRVFVEEKIKSPVGRLKSVDRSLSIAPASFALALVRATEKGLDVIDIVEDDQQVIEKIVMPKKTKQAA